MNPPFNFALNLLLFGARTGARLFRVFHRQSPPARVPTTRPAGRPIRLLCSDCLLDGTLARLRYMPSRDEYRCANCLGAVCVHELLTKERS